MNQPSIKRPRRARMRMGILNADRTAASQLLLDRARSYLTGDEVFDALYQHALDLEEDNTAEELKRANEDLATAKNDLGSAIDEVVESMKPKKAEHDAARRRLVDLNDKISALASKQEEGELHDALTELSSELDAAIDEIPIFDEEFDKLEEAREEWPA